MQTVARAGWRRSSYSGTSGQSNCVEARDVPGMIAVRDSKDPAGPRLVLTPAAWRSFTASVKAGGRDLA